MSTLETSTLEPELCFKFAKVLILRGCREQGTALTVCAEGGCVDLGRFLIDAKADVNAKTRLYPEPFSTPII